MKFNLHVKFAEGGAPWVEDYNRSDITSEVEARKYAEQIIENFNNTLRPDEKARKLLDVTFEDNKREPLHVWRKSNLYTLVDGRMNAYDTLRCTVCEVTAKRYGLCQIVIDRHFRAKRYLVCPPLEEKKKRAKAEKR